MKEKLIYDVVVGYMLKVLKSKRPIERFRGEFNAIRHGDYRSFIKLVNIEIPSDVVVSHEGQIIPTENQLEIQNADFLLVLLSGPSLMDFFKRCFEEFGKISDPDLNDEDFENLANFEMVLRLHLNNIIIIDNRIDLIKVIALLGEALNLNQNEIEAIQKGREFLNMVKHNAEHNLFNNGLAAFNLAREIMFKHDIVMDGN